VIAKSTWRPVLHRARTQSELPVEIKRQLERRECGSLAQRQTGMIVVFDLSMMEFRLKIYPKECSQEIVGWMKFVLKPIFK